MRGLSLMAAVMVMLLMLIPGTRDAHALPSATLLVVGDSLSASYGIDQQAGWVALLQTRLKARKFPVSVVNASISGDTSAGGRARLPALLARHSPRWVILELGGNDGLRGLPLTELRGNLAAMIDAAQASGATVVLVPMRIPPNYGRRYTDAFEALYVDLAKQKDLVTTRFLLDGVAGHEQTMQDDGIHPTADAQPRMLDNVWPALEPLLRSHH